ncbi:hypothetical protein ACSQ67_021433 [Phaseolus vulgaris]
MKTRCLVQPQHAQPYYNNYKVQTRIEKPTVLLVPTNQLAKNVMAEQNLETHKRAMFSTPPEDPIKCSSGNTTCTITNSYGMFPDRSICHASKVLYPTTEQEIVSMVASAARSKSKMKVATRFRTASPSWCAQKARMGC